MTSIYQELAEDVLKDHQHGLHVNEIATIIFNKQPNLANNLEELSKKLGASLASAVKTKSPHFIRPTKNGKPKKGWYRLKQEKGPSLAIAGGEKGLSTQNIGKGGEHAVISELLFSGFNAGIMAIDDGIDVVALKKSTLFQFQVKTSNAKED